jgi:hypothetical protein
MEKLELKENEDSSVGCESDDSSRIVSGSEHDIFGTDGQGDDSDSIIADVKFDVRSSPLIAENAVNGLIENIDVASSETDGIDPELKYTAIQVKKSYNGGSNHDLQNQKLSIDVGATSIYTDSIDNTSPAESCHDSCSSSAPSTPRVMSKHEFGKENMLLATPPINSKRKIDLHGDNSIINGSFVDDSPSTKRKRDAARPVTRQSRRLLNKSNSQDRDHESKERKNSPSTNPSQSNAFPQATSSSQEANGESTDSQSPVPPLVDVSSSSSTDMGENCNSTTPNDSGSSLPSADSSTGRNSTRLNASSGNNSSSSATSSRRPPTDFQDFDLE